MKKILLIEDEKNLSRFIELELKHESFSVTVAFDGESGLTLALVEQWDVILLDLMLPELDGLEICRRIRALKSTPIIMLSAKDRIADRVAGLDLGADDYLVKPFAIQELLARIRVILRRQEGSDELVSPIQIRDLCLDQVARTVKRGQQMISLTKREFELLAALMQHANRVMSRELLLDSVWGFESAVDTNVVDVYIRYLRNKIDCLGEVSYIETLRGVGYVMRK